MATQATTTVNGDSEVRMREKKVTNLRQNGNHRHDNISPLSTSNNNSLLDDISRNETQSLPSARASTYEPAFFFGLSTEDALNSTENVLELFYNACKYNHLELVQRCVEEKHVNVNEPFHNDYALCIAR